MSTQHTPGPGDLEEDTYGEEIWLGGAGAGMIVVNGWVNGGCMDDPAQWATLQADARLIRAAPDLLAALEAIADGSVDPAIWPDLAVRYEKFARAAIAKAKSSE